jgi:hypothetical protein
VSNGIAGTLEGLGNCLEDGEHSLAVNNEEQALRGQGEALKLTYVDLVVI